MSAGRMGIVMAAVLAMIAWFAGCGGRPDIVSTDKKPGEAYSADEVRQITVDQPFLLSGDYFRNRDQEPSIDLGKVFGEDDGKSGEKPAPAAASAVESGGKETASARRTGVSSPPPLASATPDAHLPVKLGVIIDKDRISEAAARRLADAVKTAAAELPLVLTDSDRIEEVMGQSVCPPKDLSCISGALSVYPGLRMVVLAERLDLPGTWPGEIGFRLSLVDAGILFRYPIMEGTAPVKAASDVTSALSGVLNRVFAFAVKKAALMPWFCKPFGTESGEWYVSAGARSGVKPGDVLNIVGKGKTVKSPTGYPAGWIPGEIRGQVAVKALFGTDFAVVRSVAGASPEAEDYLMRP